MILAVGGRLQVAPEMAVCAFDGGVYLPFIEAD
jgi:hypothetical protein